MVKINKSHIINRIMNAPSKTDFKLLNWERSKGQYWFEERNMVREGDVEKRHIFTFVKIKGNFIHISAQIEDESGPLIQMSKIPLSNWKAAVDLYGSINLREHEIELEFFIKDLENGNTEKV